MPTRTPRPVTGKDAVTTVLETSFYQAALNALPTPIVVVAVGGEVVVCNDAWRHLVKARDPAAEIQPSLTFAEAHQALCGRAATAALTKGVRAVLEGSSSGYSGVYRCAPEVVRSYRVGVTPLADGHQACLVRYQDLTEQVRREETIHFEANHDALTGLPNRRLFLLEAAKVLAHAKRSGSSFALLYLDLNGFKTVNDTQGHEAGDRVLCQVAARLLALSRDSDLLARQGGDEFLILLQDVTPGQSCDAAERYHQSLAQPFEVDGTSLSLRGSFGIARYPGDGESIGDLIKCADQAMYTVKAAGGGYLSRGFG